VSVVVPVRNEGPHLERAVASILAQAYDLPFDVCLAVAPSDDDTMMVATAIAETDERISVVVNTAGVTPAGLNSAIAATDGSIVVRVDGHAELSPGYIRRAVETMCRTGAVNVGGTQVPRPETRFEEAVAAATTSWMGTGGATYRMGGTEGPVDTVYLGVFDRAAGDAVGWFDETLIRNQDYELNIRLRSAGGTIWFDPELRVGYRPRGSWQALARQYYEYGYWKCRVLEQYPRSVRLRQIAPAVLPVLLLVGTVGALKRRSLLAIPASYLIATGATAATTARRRAGVHRSILVATWICHLAWGGGFLAAIVRPRPMFPRSGPDRHR
jgi:glycosyltransferase involved in cell wall biosynthesis